MNSKDAYELLFPGTKDVDPGAHYQTSRHEMFSVSLESFFARYDGLRIDWVSQAGKLHRFFAAVSTQDVTVYTWYCVPVLGLSTTEPLNQIHEEIFNLHKKLELPVIVIPRTTGLDVYRNNPESTPLIKTNKKFIYTTGYPASPVLQIRLNEKMKEAMKSRFKAEKGSAKVNSRFNTGTREYQQAAQFDFDKSVKDLPNIKKYIGDLL